MRSVQLFDEVESVWCDPLFLTLVLLLDVGVDSEECPEECLYLYIYPVHSPPIRSLIPRIPNLFS
jgi:hypothetical protein